MLLSPDLQVLPAQVKMAYVNFVNHCYVDTEVEMKEIYTSNHIWNLFENFTLDMARVCACGSVGPSWPLEGDPATSIVGRVERSPGIGLSYPRFAASVRSAWLTPPWRSTC